MAIYGTALLSLCLLVGLSLGRWLGVLLGLDADVGGVGMAMLLLILASEPLRRKGRLMQPTRDGIQFWSSIYVPIVVAMAACQNVRAAWTGGFVALAAGGATVAICFAMVGVLVRWGQPEPVAEAFQPEAEEPPPASNEDR